MQVRGNVINESPPTKYLETLHCGHIASVVTVNALIKLFRERRKIVFKFKMYIQSPELLEGRFLLTLFILTRT